MTPRMVTHANIWWRGSLWVGHRWSTIGEIVAVEPWDGGNAARTDHEAVAAVCGDLTAARGRGERWQDLRDALTARGRDLDGVAVLRLMLIEKAMDCERGARGIVRDAWRFARIDEVGAS